MRGLLRGFLVLSLLFPIISFAGALHDAARKGNVDEIRRLLKEGVDVNSRDVEGRTPLHEAAFQSYFGAADLLLRNGADVNAEDNDGWTPLMAALAICRDIRLVKLLLAKGARINVNAHGLDHETPLFDAMRLKARRGFSVAEFLLSQGADVNIRDRGGCTPLYEAVSGEDLDAAKYLLDHKADPNSEDCFEGGRVLHTAVAKGDDGLVTLLLKSGANPNVLRRDMETPLQLAIQRKNVEIARLLLMAGADVKPTGLDVRTPLDLAVSTGSVEMVKLLLEHGADPQAKSRYDGQTAAGLARRLGYTEIAGMLLVKPAPRVVALKAGMRVFVIASVANLRERPVQDGKIVEKLPIATALEVEQVKAGTRPESGQRWAEVAVLEGERRGTHGWLAADFLTPQRPTLHLLIGEYDATSQDDIESRRMWAERAMALDASSPDARKRFDAIRRQSDTAAFIAAIKNGDFTRIKMLVEGGADVNVDLTAPSNGDGDRGVTPLLAALFKGNTEIAQFFIQHGADVNSRAAIGMGEMTATPLSVASEKGFTGIVKSLLEKGANPNHCVTNPGGQKGNGTPLILALRGGNTEIIELLIAHGANVNAMGCQYGGEGTTALLVATDDANTTAMLLAHGADPNLADGYGMTPLMWAVRHRNPESAELLLKAHAKVNATNRLGESALMQVFAGGVSRRPLDDQSCFAASDDTRDVPMEFVRLFDAYGADRTIKNTNGQDFAALAKLHKRTDLMAQLKPVAGSEFQIVPPAITSIYPLARAYGAYLNGNYLYLAEAGGGKNRLEIISLANPEQPVQVSATALSQEGLDVAVENNIAYVAADQHGLQIFDVTNPTEPVLLSRMSFPDFTTYVKVVGRVAFVLVALEDEYACVKIVDVTDAKHPKLIGEYTEKGDSARRFFVQGKYLYLAQQKLGLRIIDVRQPARPVLARSVKFAQQVVDVIVVHNLAYVGLTGDGQNVVLDVSDPANPKVIRGVDFSQRVVSLENSAFVRNCQLVVDMSDTAKPQIVGVLSNRPHVGHNQAVQGDTLVDVLKNQLWKFEEPVIQKAKSTPAD